MMVAFHDQTFRVYNGSGEPVDETAYATAPELDVFFAEDVDRDGMADLVVAGDEFLGVLTGLMQECPADLAAPFGVLNFFDVSAFLGVYNAGCP